MIIRFFSSFFRSPHFFLFVNQSDEEETNFSNSMVALMENMASLAEFWPALDFIATRARKVSLFNAKQIEIYFRKVLLFSFVKSN
jgi:hypothetical protein